MTLEETLEPHHVHIYQTDVQKSNDIRFFLDYLIAHSELKQVLAKQ